jgi:hypothetical protein
MLGCRMCAGAAMKHFVATGKKYPLVVKLGTITPHGADVYSYADDENDMVLDPYLKQHLKHWGIDMDRMEKSAKTMADLQVRIFLPLLVYVSTSMFGILKCMLLYLLLYTMMNMKAMHPAVKRMFSLGWRNRRRSCKRGVIKRGIFQLTAAANIHSITLGCTNSMFCIHVCKTRKGVLHMHCNSL